MTEDRSAAHQGDADGGYRDERHASQFEELYREDDVPLADVRTSALRVLVYAGVGMLVLVAILGAVVQIPREVTVTFALRGSDPEYVFRFFDPLYVDRRFVEVGAEVRAGDPLVRISSPRITELVAQYREALARHQIFVRTERPMYESQIEALRLEEQKLERDLRDHRQHVKIAAGIYEETLEKHRYLAEQARRAYERQTQLFGKKLIAAEDLEPYEKGRVIAEADLETLVQERRGEVAALTAAIERTILERAIVRQRRAEKEKLVEHLEATLASRVTIARNALDHNYGEVRAEEGGLVLSAPFDGRVSYVTAAERDVPEGTMLLKVMRDTTDLYAQGSVPAKSVGLVRAGDPVVMKVHTFPHYEWGTVAGRIRKISLTPDERGTYPFETEITDAGRLQDSLKIGMTGELSVLVERKSFFAYIFHHAKRGYHAAVEGESDSR